MCLPLSVQEPVDERQETLQSISVSRWKSLLLSIFLLRDHIAHFCRIVPALSRSLKTISQGHIHKYTGFPELTGEIRTVLIPKHKMEKLMLERCAPREDFCDLLPFWQLRVTTHTSMGVLEAIRAQDDCFNGGLVLCCPRFSPSAAVQKDLSL